MYTSLRPVVILTLLVGFGCQAEPDLESIGTLSRADLPPSPTNAYADDPAAAILGQALFFDARMSADGQVSCASCHDPDNAFADPRAFSRGSFGRLGERHAPSLINVAFNRFQLWDGRADALWSQPIKAIEASAEGDFSRTELAHFITREYAEDYIAVFGPIPSLAGVPDRAKPGDAAWDAMTEHQQDIVNRIAANVGKAIEAYERKLICVDTEFDRHLRGETTLSNQALQGAEIFLDDDARCVDCHSGPNLTDGRFHNLGLDHAGTPDRGRADGVEALLDDPFNGVGDYSDDPTYGAQVLAEVALGRDEDLGAFKTPGLRGVAQRARFGHLGHESNLERWIDDVYRRGGGGNGGRGNGRRGGDGGGGGNDNFVGQRSDLFPRDVENEEAVAAFLRTLDCPPLPPSLLGPPGAPLRGTDSAAPASAAQPESISGELEEGLPAGRRGGR